LLYRIYNLKILYLHLFDTLQLCLYTDEEHKLGKERLSEMIERSLPSHIYILVRIAIIYHNKNALIMLYYNMLCFYSRNRRL